MKKFWDKETNKKREERVAKELKGKRVSGSGATPWAKEDIVTDQFLVQHKSTSKASHSIKKEDLENLRRNAIDVDKKPLYVVDFDKKRYYIIGEHLFDEFVRYLNNI